MAISPEQTMWDIKGDLGKKIIFKCDTVALGSFCWNQSELDKLFEFKVELSGKGIMAELPFYHGMVYNFAFPPAWINFVYIHNGPVGFQIFLEIRKEMIVWINQVLGLSYGWFYPYIPKNCQEARIVSFVSSSNPSLLMDIKIIFQQFYGTQIKDISETEANSLFLKSCVTNMNFK